MVKTPSVAIIDYGMGNLFSVLNVCEHIGLNATITNDKKSIMESDAAILPGVGAFGDAMENLAELDLILPIKDFIESGRYFLGICLGQQLLMTESEEFGIHKGLDIIQGRVIKFPDENKTNKKIKVPQVGWNKIYSPNNKNSSNWVNTPLENIPQHEFMYFVHSLHAADVPDENILCLTDYENVVYPSGVFKKNVFAFQYHPEKSAKHGIKIYENFKTLIINRGNYDRE